jgi:hypothetical protein
VQLREREQEIKRRPAAVVRSGWAIKLLSGGPIKAKMCVAGHTHTPTPRVCTEAANWHNLSGCHVRRAYENVSCMQIKVIAQGNKPQIDRYVVCTELLWASRTIKRPAGHLVGQTLGRA